MTDIANNTAGLHDLGGLENLLSFYIRSINIAVSRDLDNKLSGLDVAKGTGKISTLLIVSRHPGIRPSAIADLIMRDRSSMGRLIDKMVAQGLVMRQSDPNDQRSQALYLTHQGHSLARQVIDLTQQQDRDFFHMVSEEEKSLMINLFNKIVCWHRTARPDFSFY
ncbi:MarR family winged helix-turn-helix transcriptional regulator [Pseudomonas graminis]